jgi:hypothetical protein
LYSAGAGNVGIAAPNVELNLERIAINIVASLGLGLRLGLSKTQAWPKPISSPHQGWALARLEWARLGGLRA